MSAVSRRARARRPLSMGGLSSSYAFGDVVPGPEPAAPLTEEQWRKRMLEQQTTMTDWLTRWVKRDEIQRWLQLGATLAIPLSAAIWRAIFRAGRKPT